MKRVLIVCALSKELNAVKIKIKNIKSKKLKFSFFTTGVGNYNTILNLSRFLENNYFDFVVNIGVCGYREEKKEAFQVARIFNLSNKKELIVPTIIDFLDIDSVASSEKVVYESDVLGEEKYVDMESYGFELVCDSFKLPRIIIKIPADKIGEQTLNFDTKKAIDNLSNNLDYSKLVSKISLYLENQIEADDFEKYFVEYSFTFSEKEIFKKYFYRYKSLVGNDFMTYFEKNKDLNKKIFLKNLEVFLDGYLIK